MSDLFFRKLCHHSFRRPAVFFLVSSLFLFLGLFQLKHISLNMDPLILLPKESRASMLSRRLEKKIGQNHFFYILYQGENKSRLIDAVEKTAGILRGRDDIKSVVYHYPMEFIKKYRYLLIPSLFLNMIEETLIQWEAEINPLGDNLLEEFEESTGSDKNEYIHKRMNQVMKQYGNLEYYFLGKENRSIGMILYPRIGLKDMKQTLAVFKYLKGVTGKVSEELGIWGDVGGPLNRWINSFKIAVSDIKKSGMVMGIGILILLIIGFRRIRILPVLFVPLVIGLIYSLELIPLIVGELNIITSFFLVVSFGLGIDFSIHLVRRFQTEIQKHPVEEALFFTFVTTGKSVVLSGLTTSLSLLLLSISSFRGISDFGLVGGTAIFVILLAIVFLMPSVLVLGVRLKLITPKHKPAGSGVKPVNHRLMLMIFGLVLVSGLYFFPKGIMFDYDFSKMGPNVVESEELKNIQDSVFPTSMPPNAFFVAEDLDDLDKFLDGLETHLERSPGSTLGWVNSFRDICPSQAEAALRFRVIYRLKGLIHAKWINHIEDPDKKQWIENFKEWVIPQAIPSIEEVPAFFLDTALTQDGSNEYLVGLFPKFERRDGKNNIAFTREIYGLGMPDGISGPAGEGPVVAEIIQLVIKEGPWIFFLTFLGVFCMTFLLQRSAGQALIIMIPLVLGMILFVGIMGAGGLKINFFNIVVFPALLGMGVDDGIHYFRQYRETGSMENTQRDLFGTLSLTTFSTVLGYAGLMLASHPGLFSIGLLATIGLVCMWFASLFLFPVILRLLYGDNG